ncbi:MAG TPA: helix-turn-helix transcriptional regulator [Thermoanaerobaculia bacterium]|jgi:transcriptional regulator with XRE-family HTH domain
MPRPRRDPGQLSNLGRVLRTLREGAGLTLADLAAAVGVHVKTVSRWELCGILPPADQLRVLAGAVDPERPTRAKARILEAAGLLDPEETEMLIQAAEVANDEEVR